MKIAIVSDSHDNIPNIEKALKWINKEGIRTIIHCGDLCAPSTMTHVFVPNFDGEIHFVHGNVGDNEVLDEMVKDFKNVHIYNWHYSTSKQTIVRTLGRTKNSFRTMSSNSIMGCGEITVSKSGHPELAKDLDSSAKSPQNDTIKIAFTHTPSAAKELANTGKYDYVFYGHDHKPWFVEIPKTKSQLPNKFQIQNSNNQNKLTMQQCNNVTILANPGTLAGMFYKATFAVLDTEKNVLELKILELIS